MNKHTPHLLALLFAGLVGPVWSSALFEDTTANLWLIDTDSGQVTSYGFGDWLTSYKQAESDLPLPLGNFQALVNSLPNSSEPMSNQQPGVSIISLSEAERQLGDDTGPDLLSIMPASGSYNSTIGVQLRVEPRQLDQGDRTLRWRLNEGDWQSRTLTKEDQKAAGSDYIEQPLYLIRAGMHLLETELRANGSQLAKVDRVYQLSSDDPLGDYRDTDEDGVPDLVEQALGLSPLNKDLDTPSHIDGWSRFDLWLRCDADELDTCTEPVDTDQDGWTDIDETWRGTEPEDVIVSGFIEAPEPDSEAERQLIRHYQEFPAARRLYEVEYQLGGDPMGLTPGRLTAATFTGQSGWQTSDLVTSADLSNAVLTAPEIASSRLLNNAEIALKTGIWPSLRLPAGDAVMLRASRVLPNPGGEARQSDLLYLPPRTDLEPNGFNVQDFGSWSTANDWKGYYQTWLQASLVEPASPVFEQATSHSLLVLEQLLAEEARLRNISDQTRLGVPGQPLSWLSDLKADLEHRSPDVTLSQLIAGLEATLQPDGLLSEDGAVIAQWLADIPASLNSSTWLQQKLAFSQTGENIGCFVSDSDWNELNENGNEGMLQQFLDDCPVYHTGTQLTEWQTESQDRRYRLRLMLLAQGATQLSNDASLTTAANDSDSDDLTNGQEITVRPYRLHTLPWLNDTDTDGFADASDVCPLDRYNACTGTPDENQLFLGNDLTVSKPETQGMVLLSVQLDRPAVGPVTVNYQIWASSEDSAVDGEDFIASTGQIVIQPGQNAVLIPVTLLGGGSGQEFRLEVLSVNGAALTGDAYTLVGLTDFDPLAPVANVMATNLSVDETQTLVLDASASYDPNGDDLGFTWQQTAGLPVSLDTTPDTGFAELTAPNLAANESLTFSVTVTNDAALTDSAQIEVLIMAEDQSPEVVGSVVYAHYRQEVLTVPLADLRPLINDPEGSELSFDAVLTQPNGSLASLVGTNLVIDGDIAIAQALGTQGGESSSLVRWRDNGFAFLTSPSEAEAPRLYGWEPDTGLQVLHQGVADETLSSLIADPILDRLYFDTSLGTNRTVSWRDSDGSINDVAVTRNFMGSDTRQPNSLHGEGGLYLCSTSNYSWFYLDTAAQTVTGMFSSCGYTSVTQQNAEQVCLASVGNMHCTAPGSKSANLTELSSFMGYKVISSAKLGDTFLFLVESADSSVTKLLRYTASHELVLLREWASSSIGYDLNTEGDRLIMAVGLGDRIEMLSWQVGDEDVTVHGSNYFSNTGETYSYLTPLQVTESGEVYWLLKTDTTTYEAHQFDLQTNQFGLIRSLDLDQSPVTYAYGFNLALSPRGPLVATEHTDGLCYWQRLSDNGALAAPHLESTLCNAQLTNEQVEVHLNYDDPNRRFFRVSGGDFIGETLIQVLISDPGGNTVILPIELDVAEAP